mmetsp:Transcript_12352/g.23707  ORF Transcript_12352/g.23707 Transcript_12352/m.23707 type:complete len:217 (-) Transcript_12352:553-1203(-)
MSLISVTLLLRPDRSDPDVSIPSPTLSFSWPTEAARDLIVRLSWLAFVAISDRIFPNSCRSRLCRVELCSVRASNSLRLSEIRLFDSSLTWSANSCCLLLSWLDSCCLLNCSACSLLSTDSIKLYIWLCSWLRFFSSISIKFFASACELSTASLLSALVSEMCCLSPLTTSSSCVSRACSASDNTALLPAAPCLPTRACTKSRVLPSGVTRFGPIS